MLIQKIKTYKWQALASLLMTGLMVASSLLQPRYLQEVLDALLAGKYEAIYSIGAWLIGVAVVGLVAGGLNVVLAAYIAQGVSSDLREDAFRKIQTFSSMLSLQPILPKEFHLTFGRMPSVKSKPFLMPILNNLMREI